MCVVQYYVHRSALSCLSISLYRMMGHDNKCIKFHWTRVRSLLERWRQQKIKIKNKNISSHVLLPLARPLTLNRHNIFQILKFTYLRWSELRTENHKIYIIESCVVRMLVTNNLMWRFWIITCSGNILRNSLKSLEKSIISTF